MVENANEVTLEELTELYGRIRKLSGDLKRFGLLTETSDAALKSLEADLVKSSMTVIHRKFEEMKRMLDERISDPTTSEGDREKLEGLRDDIARALRLI